MGTTALRRRMLVTLEINNKDKSYEWFLAWMALQTALQKQKSIFAPWAQSHQLSVETVVEQRKNGSSSALFRFVAGPGTHYFKYKDAWLQVSHILACDGVDLFPCPISGQTRKRNSIYATDVRSPLGDRDPDHLVKRQSAISLLTQ